MTENNNNDTNNNKLKKGKNAYQREDSFQGKKHLLFLHGPEVGHVLRQQEGLVQGIGYVPNLALLESLIEKSIRGGGEIRSTPKGVSKPEPWCDDYAPSS